MNFKDYIIFGMMIGFTVLLSPLKFFGIINSSWVWVFVPIWFPLTILAIIMGIGGAYFAVKDYLEEDK